MLTFKRTVLAGALFASLGLGLGTIGCTDKNDAGKITPPATDAGMDGGGGDAKTDGTTTGTGGSGGSNYGSAGGSGGHGGTGGNGGSGGSGGADAGSGG